MSAAGGAILVLFLFVGIGGGLVLYLAVRSEHDDRDRMDRRDAERVARRDAPGDDDR